MRVGCALVGLWHADALRHSLLCAFERDTERLCAGCPLRAQLIAAAALELPATPEGAA